MTLGDSIFNIHEGDLIFIPSNTFHAVITTSKKLLKVLSVQSPFFDGRDRIFTD
jgi:mannose-6-phosphate isomerase-like protein (cupin superfamily)